MITLKNDYKTVVIKFNEFAGQYQCMYYAFGSLDYEYSRRSNGIPASYHDTLASAKAAAKRYFARG